MKKRAAFLVEEKYESFINKKSRHVNYTFPSIYFEKRIMKTLNKMCPYLKLLPYFHINLRFVHPPFHLRCEVKKST